MVERSLGFYYMHMVNEPHTITEIIPFAIEIQNIDRDSLYQQSHLLSFSNI